VALVWALAGFTSCEPQEPAAPPDLPKPSPPSPANAPEVVLEPHEHEAPALPFSLLATVSGAHPLDGAAMLRDHARGRILRIGATQAVAPDVVLLEVHPEGVLLAIAGIPHRLAFEPEPVALMPDDLLYPDLDFSEDLSNSMMDAVRLPVGPTHTLKRPHLAWGTPRTVHALLAAFARYHERDTEAPPIVVGDLSAQRGGPLPPHVSHQSGRDVDIDVVWLRGRAGSLDLRRTWSLLDALLSTGKVAYVFLDYELQARLFEFARSDGVAVESLRRVFQYPRGERAATGVVRHWPGHRRHLHVRFAHD